MRSHRNLVPRAKADTFIIGNYRERRCDQIWIGYMAVVASVSGADAASPAALSDFVFADFGFSLAASINQAGASKSRTKMPDTAPVTMPRLASGNLLKFRRMIAGSRSMPHFLPSLKSAFMCDFFLPRTAGNTYQPLAAHSIAAVSVFGGHSS